MSSGVTYQPVDSSYFEQRQLRRHAGLFSLRMMGVGAIIAGEYSGCNIGFSQGGFGGRRSMRRFQGRIGGGHRLVLSPEEEFAVSGGSGRRPAV